MRRFRAMVIAAIAVAAAVPTRAEAPLPVAVEVLGTVTNAARPVAQALVIALNLQDFAASQAWTAADGSFTLPALRAGVYKIIAVKQGFVPAITTLVPTKAKHTIALKLDNERTASRSVNQEIWEMRASLPPDVLHDLDSVMHPVEIATYEIPRFRGEMLSVTGVTNTPANTAYAQTSVGVQGRIGERWQVGIRGNLRRFEDPNDEVRFGEAIAESSVMSMEIRPSAKESYKVASTKSSWLYTDPSEDGAHHADVRAHNFEWQRGPAHVQVRYFEQENLFRDQPNGSNLIEIGGRLPVYHTRRSDLDVGLRVTQESLDRNGSILRMADLSANGTIAAVPSVILHYGLASRVGLDGQELAPRTGAEWKITDKTSIVGSVLYKVLDRETSTVLVPSLVFWTEDARVLPRYAYTLGFVSGKEGKTRFSAIATVTAVDDPFRVFFADDQTQFWDGLYVESGDVRRDLRIAYRREFGNLFAIDLATSAGTATPIDPVQSEREKVYVTGDLQSTFNPTRTTIAVSYREIQQPGDPGEDEYHTERIHLRMAQSLYLPVDLKLLLGLELARAENSPYLIESITPEGRSRKYIGGLALNF